VEQRRFLTFLLLSILVWMFFNALFGRRQPADNQPPAPVGAAGQPAEGPAAAAAVAADLPQIAELETEVAFATLGSLDPESGYRMLVTFNSAGASVQRAELSSKQYLDQDDRAGYLGELELDPVDGGLRVQVVGPGTPAAAAGIRVGDILVAARIGDNELPALNSPAAFASLLAESRPEQEITLQVRRGEAAPQAMTATLKRRPFAVVRTEIENFRSREDDLPQGFVDRPSFLLKLSSLGDKKFDSPDLKRIAASLAEGKAVTPLEQQQLEFANRIATLLEQGNWQLNRPNDTTVEFTRPIGELGLTMVKRYTLAPVPAESRGQENFPGYHLQLEIELRNVSAEPLLVSYRLDGPTGMTTEGWWYAHKISRTWSTAGLRDVVVRFDGRPVVQLSASAIAEGDVEPMGEGNALAFAGVDGQYFSAIVIPQKTTADDPWIETTEGVLIGPRLDPELPSTYNNVTSRLTRKAVELPANGSHADSFQIFLGPQAARVAGSISARRQSVQFALRRRLLRLANLRRRRTGDARRSPLLLWHRRQLWRCRHHADGPRSRLHVSTQLEADAKHGPHAGAETGDGPDHGKI
jgi:YidC/Oxa1 family membrane protein insertase